MKKIISLALVLMIVHQSSIARAQFAPNNMSTSSVREYFIGRDLGKPLVTVHMLNGVSQPGVYHIPVDSNIAELLAYAGGATERSDLTEITVRRGQRGNFSVTELDLEKALHEPQDLFHIQDQDVIQIHQKMSLDRPLAWASILSAIASVVLTVVLVSRENNK